MRHWILLAAMLSGCVGDVGAPADEHPQALAPATYRFERLVAPDKCLDVAGAGSADGTKIHEWTCNGTGAQSFTSQDLGGGLVRLVNTPTGKCVDVAGAGKADGTQVHLWTCNGTGAQSFVVEDTGGGEVLLRNPNSNKCVVADSKGTGNGAKVHIWTCDGAVTQKWRPVALTPPPPPPPSLPAHVVAGYYPNWTSAPIRLRDIPAAYNVIYLFAARPEGGAPGTTGRVIWTPPGNGRGAATNLVADLAYVRGTQKRKVLMSVGGAGNGMSFPDRAKSQAFVDSITELHAQLGGFDGLDWNTFEGNQHPDTDEMIWISLELKKRFPGFLITAPPAPWNNVDKVFCQKMAQAGALDYAAPQYYDGPNLDQPAYVIANVASWVTLLGASKVVVGFGVWDQTYYMTIGEAVEAWNGVAAAHPSIRGAFDWNIHLDEGQGWPFASQLGPIVNP